MNTTTATPYGTNFSEETNDSPDYVRYNRTVEPQIPKFWFDILSVAHSAGDGYNVRRLRSGD